MKIGIITMHRVLNIGSVLQAYALQYSIQKKGHEAELIDYLFPPSKKRTIRQQLMLFFTTIVDFLQSGVERKRRKKIKDFRTEKFSCSSCAYDNEKIHTNPPMYDIYCTGSDQVWNPTHVGNDTSFLLSFAPCGVKKIAYAASFANNTIPESLNEVYAKYISQYRHITVREASGIDLVKKLVGREASLVADPTILLTADEWLGLSQAYNNPIKDDKYILVYILRYMFDPRPNIYEIINCVKRQLGLPIYFIEPGYSEMKQKGARYVKGLGPGEFINVFANATFVITDSFHGTAFSTIFNKPMIGVIKDTNSGDGRISTLRKVVDGANSIVQYTTLPIVDKNNLKAFQCDEQKLKNFRESSLAKLNEMLES